MSNEINGQSVLRFADIEILRYGIEGFAELPLERKLLVYHLSEAALSGRDIVWDQHNRYGLRIRHILETVYVHGQKEQSRERECLIEYLRRVWFSSGLHHHYGSEKFEPRFSRAYLEAEIARLQREECRLLEYAQTELRDILDEIFDAARSPKLTEQSGEADLIAASSVNFYDRGVRQSDVEQWYEQQAAADQSAEAPISYGLNTRVGITEDGALYEQPYAIGGLYGKALEAIAAHLKAALAYTDTEAQRLAILALLDYYKTGDLAHYNRFCILWVQDVEVEVDFINGFTETYTDPLGLKGSWEGIVHLKSERASSRTRQICAHAAWFEAHAPIDPRFRKSKPVGVSGAVVTAVMFAGDSYPAVPLGVNLPNADWIRAEHGSKSITIENIHQAYRAASQKSGMDEAFIPNAAVREMLARYEVFTEPLHTDLHECLGHGSGQLLSGVSPDALGAYGSVIEEARADLFALYYMADEKLVALELLPDQDAYKACYYRYMLAGLVTQLVRIRPGHTIEEAHMRNRALIARWTLEAAGADCSAELNGTELIIHNYEALRGYFARLLAEVQRIKSEGDFAAARQLVERYAIHVEPELHASVLARYKTLDIAPYRGFVNPRLELVWDEGAIADVQVDYSEGYDEQMLRYSRDYSTLPLDPVGGEEHRAPQPSVSTLSIAKELRTALRTSMDGVVSASMRDKGLHYGINFGLTLEYIERRAAALPHALDLARYLLSRDVRELRLIGLMIYPSEKLTFSAATAIASSSFSNPELRDCMAKYLLDRAEQAPQFALAWLSGVGYEDLHAIAYTTLARHLVRGFVVECAAHRALLMRSAIDCLSCTESERITPAQRGALLLLKKWLRVDGSIAHWLRNHETLDCWAGGDNPILREFAADLRFELDFQ